MCCSSRCSSCCLSAAYSVIDAGTAATNRDETLCDPHSAAGKLSRAGGRASKLRDCWAHPGVERSSAARIQGPLRWLSPGRRRLRPAWLRVRRVRATQFLTWSPAPDRTRPGVCLPPTPVLQPWWSQHSLVAAGDRCRRALRSPAPPPPPPRSVLILMRFLLRSPGAWAWPFMLVHVVLVARRHLHRTSPQDRARVQQLLRRSRGRPARLTPMNGRIYSKPFGA
jgi:hypothetical protein